MKVEVISGQTLDKFIQVNICDKLGLTATTFHPESHPQYNERKVELAMRGQDGKLTAIPIPYPIPAKDDLGGTGLYTTPREYTKFLATLLAGGGNVLKPDSVDQIFMPQLDDSKYMMDQFSRPGSERINKSFTPGKEVHMGLSVGINLDQVPDRRSPGAVSWGGYTNMYWVGEERVEISQTLIIYLSF
jgi:CubicO group peptidase (beta-lactamase class C family)